MDGPTLTPKRTRADKLAQLREEKIAELRQLKIEKDEHLENVAANQLHLNTNIKNLAGSLEGLGEAFLEASRATKDIGHGNTSRTLYSLREKVCREVKRITSEMPQAKGGKVPEGANELFSLAHEVRQDFENIKNLAGLEGVNPDAIERPLSGVSLRLSSLDMQMTQFDFCRSSVEHGVQEIKEIYSQARELRKGIDSLERVVKRQESQSGTAQKFK